MFGFFKKAEQIKTPLEIAEFEVKSAISTKDPIRIQKIIKEQFEKNIDNELVLSWICGGIFELNITPLFELIEIFIEKFPESLYPPRALYADLLARDVDFDEATEHARLYLRLFKDRETFNNISSVYLVDAVFRSFLVLTSAYTTVGAREYSIKILMYANKLDAPSSWKVKYDSEINNLQTELQNSENQILNNKWQDFFLKRGNLSEIFKICDQFKMERLARRMELINGNFMFNSAFEMDDNEILLVTDEVKLPNKEQPTCILR